MLVPIGPLVLYLTIATCGYLTFGNQVPSNVINGYPNTPLLSVARAVLGVVMLCNVPLDLSHPLTAAPHLLQPLTYCTLTYCTPSSAATPSLCQVPLNIFPSRVSTLSLMEACSRARDPTSAAPEDSTSTVTAPHLFIQQPMERRLTVLFLAITGGTALVVNDLGAAVAVIGSTGATMIALVCPPAAYLLLGRGGKDAAPRYLLLDVLAAVMLVVGLAIVPSKLFCA